ncbi:MAG TPA: hypothetical protein VGP69_00680 [Gaiellaceae bacterium]|jgi:hypothetical protein|nr:hypothetical protein [Gaiellaceae bacterium]
MVARQLRRRGLATFALLVVMAEVAGRSLTARVDARLHVQPLANSATSYYPFLLVGLKIVCAFALAALLARASRARAAAKAGERLLAAVGHHERAKPRLRPQLSVRVWLASFAASSLLYLVHFDIESSAGGRWPSLDPWLHTYSLPVFALIAVAVACAWRFASWLHEVEDYVERTFARVRRILSDALRVTPAAPRPADDSAPRRRFGLSFESRPPPLTA